MKSNLLSWIALLGAAVALVVMRLDWNDLPERVAVHFDASGRPNRWDSKTSLTVGTAVLHLGVAAVLVVITSVMHRLPPSMMNLPKADYWRRPENHPRACQITRVWARWFCTGQLVWAIFMDRELMLANRARPPHLDSEAVWVLAAVMVAFTAVSITVMLVRLMRIPGQSENKPG